jgi:ABC-2 type transport system permease protein
MARAPSSFWLYARVARNAFGRYATYRASTVGGAVANTVVGVLRASVLLAVVVPRGSIRGFTASDAATFAFLAVALDAPVSMFAPLDLAARIRTGDVAVDLYRPLDVQAYWLAHEVGRAAFQLLTRLAPPLLAGGLLFHLRIPSDPRVWFAFAAALAGAIVLSFALRFVLTLSAFWLLDGQGVQGIANIFATLLSGWMVPLALFPPAVARVGRNLPWASLLQLPAEVFLQSGGSQLLTFARQLAWTIALLGLGRVLLRRATRRLVVQGG